MTVQQCKDAAFPRIPEYFEQDPESSLLSRQQLLEQKGPRRTLGPADLVHTTKSYIPSEVSNTPPRRLSSYHHVMGVDCASSATIATYINNLVLKPQNENMGWLRRMRSEGIINTNNAKWRVSRVVYCSYDAFSGRDIRVEAHIPGSVRSYQVGDGGRKDPVSQEQWAQVALSAVLRFVLSDSSSGKILVRDHQEVKERLLEYGTDLYKKGWQVGNLYGNRISSLRSNCISLAVKKIGMTDPKFQIVFARKLLLGDCEAVQTEARALLVEGLLLNDQEKEALQEMQGKSASLLSIQARFLISKNQSLHFSEALALASRAVALVPNEVDLWFQLARIQMSGGLYLETLRSINSIIVQQPPLTPEEYITKLNVKVEYVNKRTGVEEDVDLQLPEDMVVVGPSNENNLHSLKGEKLRGTAESVYLLLSELCDRTGWELLLELREKAFVMETDYDSGLNTDCLSPTTQTILLNKKRLCEKWLDELISCLYDDYRIYTVFNRELEHVKKNSIPYSRASYEWASLAALCERLHKKHEAFEAYVQLTGQRPRYLKGWVGLAKVYCEQRRLGHCIDCILTAADLELSRNFITVPANILINGKVYGQIASILAALTRYFGLSRVRSAVKNNESDKKEAKSSIGRVLEYFEKSEFVGYSL